jgi:hypothetical protein
VQTKPATETRTREAHVELKPWVRRREWFSVRPAGYDAAMQISLGTICLVIIAVVVVIALFWGWNVT